jgi:hypothetical protein
MSTIQDLQLFLKTSPAGIRYTGLVDGKLSDELLSAVSELTKKIKEVSKKDVVILSGDSVLLTIDDIKKLIAFNDSDVEEYLATKPLGASTLKDLAAKIAEKTNNSSLIAKMLSGDKLIVPLDEVKKAVEIIVKHELSKTAQVKLDSMSDDELNEVENPLHLGIVKNKGNMDYNPVTTQQIGKQVNKVPKKIAQDERILELSKLLYE